MPPSGSWPSNTNLAHFNNNNNHSTNNTASHNNSNISGIHSSQYNANSNQGGAIISLTMEDHDVIGSLGKALSGVNLSSHDNSSHSQGGYDAYGSSGGGGGGLDSSQGGGGGRGSFVMNGGSSWNGLSSNASTPSGLSYGFYGNDNPNPPPLKTTNSNSEHDSLQNVLYDSGIYEKDELNHHHNGSIPINNRRSSTPPPSFESRERKQSIDIFLSQSPSKALGEDAFRVMGMHRTASNPAIVNLNRNNDVIGGSGSGGGLPNLKPLASTAPSSRSESPQPLRPLAPLGSSPYNGGGGANGAGGQQLFSSQFHRMGSMGSHHSDNNGNNGYNSHNSHDGNNGQNNYGSYNNGQPSQNQQQQQFKQTQYTNASSSMGNPQSNQHHGHNQQFNHNQHQQHHHQQPPHHQQQQPPQQHQQQQQQQQPQFVPLPVQQQQQQQQQQVFYMAMPGPDGKGQILQPVQMVQIPGQPPTLMVPAMNAQGGQMPQGVMSPANGNQVLNVQGQAGGGGVMLMQAMPGNNGMGGGGMYVQDGGNGGGGGNSGNNVNAPYSQFGNDSQHPNNYGYSSKNGSGMDSMGGGGGGGGGGGAGQYPLDNGIMDPNGSASMTNNNGMNNSGNNSSALSMLYSSPHRPPLRALLGNVRRLSRDQVGCRLLQQALDEDGPAAATAILNEGLTFWAEAMVDPFGNYLFQKILERITPDERVILVKSVSTRLVNASLNLHGTRSVQKIVEVCAIDEEESEEAAAAAAEAAGEAADGEEDKKDSDNDSGTNASKRNSKKKPDTAAKILTDALKPSAARLCIDSHGNHAIQRILLKLPYQYTQFIFDAVAASVEDVARHRHGCCVIQRCLDSRHSAARTHLVSRIVEKSLELMQDAYGNYVVQYVLDVCGDDEVHAICESVIGKVCLLAIQKFSSNVMEKCLERCTDRVREEYLNELNDSDRLRELMMDPFGNYVVQRALSVSTHAQAIRLVETMKPHLSCQNGGGGIRNTAGGRRILGKICRRFPNFVLEGETFEDYNEVNQVLNRNHASPHHHHGRGRGNQGYGGMPPHPQQTGPSPNHRRGGRNHRNPHIPAYNHGGGHHVNVVQSGDGVMMPQGVYHQHHQQGGNAAYMYPQSY